MKKKLLLLLLLGFCLLSFAVHRKPLTYTATISDSVSKFITTFNNMRSFMSPVALTITFKQGLTKTVQYCSGVFIDNPDFQLQNNIPVVNSTDQVNISNFIASTDVMRNGSYILTDNRCLKISSVFGDHSPIISIVVNMLTWSSTLPRYIYTNPTNNVMVANLYGHEILQHVDYNLYKSRVLNLTLSKNQIFIIRFKEIFNSKFDILTGVNTTPITSIQEIKPLPVNTDFVFPWLDERYKLDPMIDDEGSIMKNTNNEIMYHTVNPHEVETSDWAKENLSLLYIPGTKLEAYKHTVQTAQTMPSQTILLADWSNFTNYRMTVSLDRHKSLLAPSYSNQAVELNQGSRFYIAFFYPKKSNEQITREYTFTDLNSQPSVRVYAKLTYDHLNRRKISAYEVIFNPKINDHSVLNNAPQGFYGAPLIECMSHTKVSEDTRFISRELNEYLNSCKIVGIYHGYNERFSRGDIKAPAYEFIAINYLTPQGFFHQSLNTNEDNQ